MLGVAYITTHHRPQGVVGVVSIFTNNDIYVKTRLWNVQNVYAYISDDKPCMQADEVGGAGSMTSLLSA